MFLTEFFNSTEGDSYADYKATPSITQSKRQFPKTSNLVKENSNMVQSNFKEVTEDASMSDIITAKDYIAHAISDPNRKYEYFEFLKSLRSRHGAEYSTHVHQQAAKLAKGMN